MVDEFSAFARMPQPVIKLSNITEICREAVFLECSRSPNIQIDADISATDVMVNCDSRQVSRALANILKNAAESVSAKMDSDEAIKEKGCIRVSLKQEISSTPKNEPDYVSIVVVDNGNGLPEDTERLTEPYVTTREKGTGLGLAIVRKIMEDHHGNIHLENCECGGAKVTLTLPIVHDIPNAQVKLLKASPPIEQNKTEKSDSQG